MTPTLADLVDALVTRHSALANEPDPYWQGYRQALADIGANLARIVAATPQPSPAPPRRRDNSRVAFPQ